MKRKIFTLELFKSFWLMCTTPFTAVVLIMALLQPLGWKGYMTPTTAWQLFAMCATLSAVMLLWDLPEQALERAGVPPRAMLFLDPLLRCIVVCVIVLLEGAAFGFFPLSWQTATGLIPVVVPVFAVTYAITWINYHRAKKNADKINTLIEKKNSGKN